ncbi:hypothetical protein PPL_06989 [Heterostelium album PN500]|uniref:Uncharacterized protein n=1 Tax=Heterostelium pallidum (strain ATCC 26659 / Pp 5 / PN500) TaxID=670386 RepID=D3BE36_HETP5|nr:hypothetical protein PPL_06989 [Heterostelium album PN500]EFA80167.1 hypothetical protein PPL_06989 [Heterostelium album PN500]|eukprot:XP_020432287.1 hypothetical protein PPL_06989 [Heterostelium album PN500]
MAVPFVTTGLIFALYVIFRPKLPPLSAIADAKSKQAQGVLNAPADAEAPEKQQVNISGDSSPNGSTSGSSSASSSGSSTPFLQNENHDSKKGKRELSPDSFLLQQGNNKIERFFIRMDWYSQPFFWGTNIATVIFFGIGVALCYSYGSKSNELSGYAFAMGVMAAILVFFQWLPQIYTTWISDEIGSLSLVSLCIQVPGALGNKKEESCDFKEKIILTNRSHNSRFPYLATAVQEIVLIVICAYYLIRDRKKRKAEEAEKKAKEEQEKSADYYQSEPPKPEYSEDNKDQPNNQNGSINNDIDIDTSINNQDQNNSSNNNSNSNINNQLTSNNSYENKNIILDGSSAALVENDTISTNFVVESKSIESDPKENENSEFHRDDHINGTDSIEMFSIEPCFWAIQPIV